MVFLSRRLTTVTLLLTAALGCGRSESVTDPPTDPPPLETAFPKIDIVACDGSLVTGTPWREVFRDGGFARLAEQIPGFGGLFVDGERLSVYLMDLDTRERARPILEDFLRGSFPHLAGLTDDIRWLQGRYDWRQLVVWRSCLDDRLFQVDGIVSADTDESRNRLVYGYLSEEAIGAAEAELALTSVPRDAVILEIQGPVCTLILRPSLIVEVRDTSGNPAAIGATVTARTSSFETTAEGFGDPLRIPVLAENRGGVFEIRVSKPWHEEVVIPQVVVPEGPCGVTDSPVVQVTISLVPDAPAVRQVVLPTSAYGFGASICGTTHDLPAWVMADPAVSQELLWFSRDPGIVTVEPGGTSPDGYRIGRITPVCGGLGSTWVVAASAVDPSVRDSIAVEVLQF